MGWSCSVLAANTLNVIQKLCITQSGMQNMFEHKGKRYFFEVTRKEYICGKITGSVFGMDGYKIGSFCILDSGVIKNFPYCPLKYKDWRKRYKELKGLIFGTGSFAIVSKDYEKEYDLYLSFVLNEIQLGLWVQ